MTDDGELTTLAEQGIVSIDGNGQTAAKEPPPISIWRRIPFTGNSSTGFPFLPIAGYARQWGGAGFAGSGREFRGAFRAVEGLAGRGVDGQGGLPGARGRKWSGIRGRFFDVYTRKTHMSLLQNYANAAVLVV
ncbi:MAG: hypothetical protein LBD68_02285 [Zoogloeaceae bacterium]|jgi:hypothetical protein|nr:hypothetical protein [Zoogloeaceae bacterium]